MNGARSRTAPASAIVASLALLLFAPDVLEARQEPFDLLIRGGRIVDGTGNPERPGDVAIRDGRIVAVGRLDGAEARRTVDARGLHVVPGFIDIHSHAPGDLVGDDVEHRRAHNLITQGITTFVSGPDGRNPVWPVRDEIAAYERLGIGMNAVPMVGHNTIRGLVMGDDYERPATDAEIREMRDLVREGMEDGAWGLGAGTEYRPGRFSTTDEVVELAKVVAEYGGFYFAHQRSQSKLPRWQLPSIVEGRPLDNTDGLLETIRVAREAGIPAVGSHIKVKGLHVWGRALNDVMHVDLARAEGLQVYLDHYAYDTYGGGPATIMPRWALADPEVAASGAQDDPVYGEPGVLDDFRDNLRRTLDDPESRERFFTDLDFIIDLNGGADRLIIVGYPDERLVGMTVADVAEARGAHPRDVLVHFVLNGFDDLVDGARIRPMAMSDEDNRIYMRQEYTATSSDAGVATEHRPGRHPRHYGAFVRKLAHYTRDEGVISLPFAIRAATGLPAQIIGLPDRGYVKEGQWADLVLFDYDRLEERATVLDPEQHNEGIEYVLVNGELVIDGGEMTGALPGVVIDRNEVRSVRLVGVDGADGGDGGR